MDTTNDGALQVRILTHMIGPIRELVDGLDPRSADPVDHGLATMLADDLDRHLTTLTDSPVAPHVDRHVLEIEDALDAFRARLAGVRCAEIG
jgi:hypothetical protein